NCCCFSLQRAKDLIMSLKTALSSAFTGFSAVLVTAVCISAFQAQAAAPQLDAQRVAGGFTVPLFVTAPPGDTTRLFIVQQSGQIKIIKLPSRIVNATPYLDVS